MLPLLTATSSRVNLPTGSDGAVPLWDHQQAMLARCQYIEAHPRQASSETRFYERYKQQAPRDSNQPAMPMASTTMALGIMNDPPGAGKTYVMLSLIAASASIQQGGINVIVTPSHLFGQWKESLRTFYRGTRWKALDGYADISELYMNPQAFNRYRVLLIHDGQYHTFASAWTGPALLRLIFDEMDTIEGVIMNVLPARTVWFLSASFDPTRHTSIGTFQLRPDDIPRIVCRCDPGFIKPLPPPIYETIVCDDGDIVLFDGLCDMAPLHANDTTPIRRLLTSSVAAGASSLYNLAQQYSRELVERIQTLESDLQRFDSQGKKSMDKTSLVNQINHLRTCHGRITAALAAYVAPQTTKRDILHGDILQRIISGSEDDAWIVAGAYTAISSFSEALKEADVSCVMLDGGNVALMQQALDAFTCSKARVLLLSGMREGCGLNLQRATHLLFLHAYSLSAREQIIGRAQRPGRSGPLHIVDVLNKSEQRL